MNEFVRLTSRETGGGDLFLKRSMIAAVGSYWNGKQQVTHVTLINEDIDYEVKESPAEVLALISGQKSPLTVATDCGTMHGRKDKPCRHHKFRSGTGSADSSSSKTPGSRPPPPACVGEPTAASATAETKS